MKYLVIIPVAFIGALGGIIIFGMIPALVWTILRYGSEASEHLEIVVAMMRPGAIVGSLAAVCFTLYPIS